MSYCFNPRCPKPENPDHNKFCQSCGTKLCLREHYRGLKPIGRGTFSKTFLAVDEDLPSKPYCVIKQFFPGVLSASVALKEAMTKASELFEREALQLDKLGKHPQIPQLFAYFEQSPCQYLVQEFIPGQNLAQILAVQGPFSETQIRNLLFKLLPILQFIHDHQVIHRDIKPKNIIKSDIEEKIYLVGFSATKTITQYSSQLVSGTVIGSPEYTAPEQLKGHPVFASDLYSLGATCLELLTQVSPFDLHQGETGQWQSYLARPVSASLRKILEKLLATSLKERYQSVPALLVDLNSTSGGKWQCVKTLPAQGLGVKSVVITPDHQWVVSGSEDGTLKLWNLEDPQEPVVLGGWFSRHQGWISDLILSPDGYTLVSGSGDQIIKVWNLGTGKLVQTLKKGWLSHVLSPIMALGLSQDGQTLVSGHRDGSVKVWQFSRGVLQRTLSMDGVWVESVAISGDSRVIAAGGGNGSIHIWCREQNQPLTLQGHSGPVRGLMLTGDRELLISGSGDGRVCLWQVTTGEMLGCLSQTGAVNNLALSGDSQMLACGNQDGTVALWHPYTQELLGKVWQGAGVQSLALSPDGQVLVAGCSDGKIKVWRLSASE